MYLLLQGDSLQLLTDAPESSVDAVVTDPPYMLGFMDQQWDLEGPTFSVAFWRQVRRVLKPGGHLLAFGGTRTYHRMVCAIEDAGFQVRDAIQWLYSQGFPKSLDVGKAFDAAAGAEREVLGPRVRLGDSKAYARNPTREGQKFVTSQESTPITAPATEEAQFWDGWGTALKPACELIVLARKPLSGTIAENVRTYGTGALNVDACRIQAADAHETGRPNSGGKGHGGVFGDSGKYDTDASPLGRWPANVILDEGAAAALDEQSGTLKSGGGDRSGESVSNSMGRKAKGAPRVFAASEGGASRFYYVAKPSRSEKEQGCAHLPAKSGGEATGREDGSAGVNNPRAGAGRTGGARNFHPTVKPVTLMRYLVRLVTPPGGVVLDPFTGSGTTGVAAMQEGFGFIGIEREEEYMPIARGRLDAAEKELVSGLTRPGRALGLPSPGPARRPPFGPGDGPDLKVQTSALFSEWEAQCRNVLKRHG